MTSVTRHDAERTLAAVLHTFATYLCEGHEDEREGAPIGAEMTCDGMCRWHDALDLSDTDTPSLRDHTHENLPAGSWSINWEGFGPDDWAYDEDGRLAARVAEITRGRVSVEAINGCILGVFHV